MSTAHFYFINNSHISTNDMSGGEKIAMALARHWSKRNMVFVFTSNLGKTIWEKYQILNIKYLVSAFLKNNEKIFFSYCKRVLIILPKIYQLKLNRNTNFVYSVSDFWPDSIPALFLKIKNPKVIWVAGFYLFAPKPWQSDSPYKSSIKRFFIGLAYWFSQLPIYFLIKNMADYVFVTSEPDMEKFITSKRNRDKIVVVQGGVDITTSEKYLKSKKVIPISQRKYDACFLGRFHYQKGVLELIDIWKLVCQKKPEAKLAMIGNGPLEKNVLIKIREYKLEKNIDLLGFLDGEKKYEIFKQSKMIIHPATYDSGGMAAAEGMAWELPGVSFDLESLKTYYPSGMIKTKCYNLREFADNIISLLDNEKLYQKISKEAHTLIVGVWDWEKRTDFISRKIFNDETQNKK
ncbi:hypothetical protein COU94_01395 [Candidatus Shapirobacteria bacterium CG10_big_fil_rev_8_21_14_0_10_38_8]|nr:MAG: hypothetical protein COU94_01395 [Candidatus Shapirobacteria bacterium CG10_big_fil_rev_8_21_14_0_10_38_8]